MTIFHAGDLVSWIAASDPFEKDIEGCACPQFCLMLYSRQPYMGDARRGEVVESADTVILWDAEAFVGNGIEDSVGDEVVSAYESGNGVFFFQTLQSQLVADALFDIDAVQFFKGRMVASEDLNGTIRFLLVGVENALEAMEPNGVCGVHHGCDEGDMPVAEFKHMSADEKAGAVIVQFHSIYAGAGISVAHDDDRKLAVDLLYPVHAQWRVGENDPCNAHGERHIEYLFFFARFSIGGENKRGEAILLGRLLDSLDEA